ncbi:MAG: 6-pyruvoyl trahydropterin synthase family protein [Terriglobales bacterium]
MTIRLGKTGFRFNASHSFAEDTGYDRLHHGHDYEFMVMIEGERLPGAMLFDARQLKQMVATLVIAPLDHADLNQLLPDPSLEMLAEWIWQRLRSQLPQRLRLGVQIWETRSIFAECWGQSVAPGT